MMRIFKYLLLSAPLFIIQGCSDEEVKESIPVSAKKNNQVPLKLAIVKEDQPAFTITLPGNLNAYEQVSIYPKIKGFVKKVYVDRGSFVKKGQLLAILEGPELGQAFAAMRSSSNMAYQKYLFSRQSYNRLKEASKKNGAIATIELERAYAQLLGDSAAYNSSKSEAAASGQMQNYLQIKAPFTGIITSRSVSEGALVGDNRTAEPLFQLSQQNKLRLTVAIPEKQAQSISFTTKAQFSVIDLPGKQFSASLSRNSGALDIALRSVIAEFDVDNKGTELRAGQYAKVTIRLNRSKPSLWVPVTSVIQDQSGVFVTKNENDIARRVPVQVGVSKDSLIEVFGELKKGDIVLFKGSGEIKEGTRLSVTK